MSEKILSTGGEDTVHVSLYCTWRDVNALDEIHAAKMAAQEHANKKHEDIPATVTAGEFTYHVKPEGFAPDKGGAAFCYFPFRMIDAGITIGLRPNQCSTDSKTPNVRVEIGSLPLMLSGGLAAIWPTILARVTALGAVVHKNRLGRVDPCVDLPGVHVSELQKALVARQWISRAKRVKIYETMDVTGLDEVHASEFEDPLTINTHASGWRKTGFTVGRSRISCNAYDKLAEVANNEEKRESLINLRYGSVPAAATRVEFRLGREALRGFTIIGKQNGIETVEDWLEHRASITAYLTTQWLRFVNSAFDPNHTDRLTFEHFHPVWKRVYAAFQAWAGVASKKVSRVPASIKLQSERLWDQAAGCAMTAMQRAAIEIDTTIAGWEDQFVSDVSTAMRSTLKRVDFLKKWTEKRDRLEVSIPPSILHPFKRVANCVAGVTHTSPGQILSGSAFCRPSTASGTA